MRFFRIYFTVAGGHTHTRWYSGARPGRQYVMGKCGELTFVNDEWDSLRELLHHSSVEFIEENNEPTKSRSN